MAKKSIISTAFDSGVISFVVEGAGSFTVDLTALSDDLRQRALIHGIVQKVSDGAAIPKADLPSDPSEIAAVKFEAMQSIADRLIAGEWSKRTGDGAGPVAGIIYRAFEEWAMARAKAAKKTLTPAECRAVYDAKDRAGQLALRNVPEIGAIIERMKAEKGNASTRQVDTDGLLGELGL